MAFGEFWNFFGEIPILQALLGRVGGTLQRHVGIQGPLKNKNLLLADCFR
jgi:hypothetical protein